MSALANFVARIAKLLHLPGFDQKDDAPKPYDPLSSIKATPAPVAAIPDDLRAKRELFQKINPGATLTPSPLQPKDVAVLRYDPLTSVRPPVRQQEPDVRPAPPARPQFDPRASISPTMHSWSSPLPVAVTNLVKPTDKATEQRAYLGRDPRSPQLGPNGYTPSPVSAAAQSPKITVAAPKVDVKNDIAMTPTISVTASLDGIVASLASKISSLVMGEVRVSTRTSFSDGQAYARTPDMGGPR